MRVRCKRLLLTKADILSGTNVQLDYHR